MAGHSDAAGDAVPNGAAVPNYYTLNAGVEQAFKINETQKLESAD